MAEIASSKLGRLSWWQMAALLFSNSEFNPFRNWVTLLSSTHFFTAIASFGVSIRSGA
jgi:hypothetical protein